jgi:four helix bundle protein
VIRLSKASWKPHAAALFNQLQRASLSVELNIAEGYSFGDSPSYTRHLGVAYGSAVETAEILRLGVEAEVFPEHSGAILLHHAAHGCRLLLGLLKRRRSFPE